MHKGKGRHRGLPLRGRGVFFVGATPRGCPFTVRAGTEGFLLNQEQTCCSVQGSKLVALMAPKPKSKMP